MSDTDDGSDDGSGDDGFDREAERERLEEKYERDQQRREATQQMSELLLKGATMTNHHCDACGSPIFRHDGEEFCPNCGGATGVQEDQAAAGGQETAEDRATADQGTGGATADDRQRGEAAAAGDGTAGPDERPRGPADGEPTVGRHPSSGNSGDRPADAGGSGREVPGGSEPPAPERSLRPDPSELQADRDEPGGPVADRGRGPAGGVGASGADEPPSMGQAKASLRRAIVSLSEQAAQSDDPERAQELLKGTREAAEALSVLRED